MGKQQHETDAQSQSATPNLRSVRSMMESARASLYSGSVNFSSAIDIVQTASTQHIDSAIIQACPDVCSQAYGHGNADLEGIGIFTIYGPR